MIETQMVFAFVARQSQPSGSNGGRDRQPVLCDRMFVDPALGRTLAGACRERYGKWKAVHRRFSRWRHAGVWERAFDALTADRTIGT
ncbi:transposase [Rhizobium leguminosarum bv. viciae]|nr:transposase [Rhizobium leguminosarum bv. viciae]